MFIIVDKSVSRDESDAGWRGRYIGQRGRSYTVSGAGAFESRERADQVCADMPHECVVRRVRSSRLAAKLAAAEDNIATLRTQLDAYQATDEECTAALARVTAERDALADRVAELTRLLSTEVGEAAE